MAAHFASDDILKATIEAVQKTSAVSKVAETWYADLDKFLAKVEKASGEDLQSESFLKNLWEDTTVASTGNGSVIIAPALEPPRLSWRPVDLSQAATMED